MRTTSRRAVLALCTMLALPSVVVGQARDVPDITGSIISRAPVTGAPFVAEVTVSIPRVVGAARTTYEGRARYMRDGQGRVRVDQFVVPMDGGRSGTEARSIIQQQFESPGAVLVDHAQRLLTDVGSGMARMLVGGGNYYVVATGQRRSLNAIGAANTQEFHGLGRDAVREAVLGSRLVAGVEAEGRRLTVVLPAGAERNSGPLEIVEERWDSPALGITLYARLVDPRVGVAEYSATSVTRVEPGSEHFALPDGYSLGTINPTYTASWESWLNPPSRGRRY